MTRLRSIVDSMLVAIVLTIGMVGTTTAAPNKTYRLSYICRDGESQALSFIRGGLDLHEVRLLIRDVRKTAGTGPVDVMDGICSSVPDFTIEVRVGTGPYTLLKYIP